MNPRDRLICALGENAVWLAAGLAVIARARIMAGTEPPQVRQVEAGVHQVTPISTDGSSSSIAISASARKLLGAVFGGRHSNRRDR
jgi:hypothetical protein